MLSRNDLERRLNVYMEYAYDRVKHQRGTVLTPSGPVVFVPAHVHARIRTLMALLGHHAEPVVWAGCGAVLILPRPPEPSYRERQCWHLERWV